MPSFLRLENETIRVSDRGQWFHGSDPITERVAKFFARHIVVQEDGAYAIRLGGQQQVILADDTPFTVTRVQECGQQKDNIERLILHTSDDRQEELDPRTLMQSTANVLYCRLIRDGHSVPCRFQPGQYHSLALMAEKGSKGYYLPLGGKRYLIANYDGLPRKKN